MRSLALRSHCGQIRAKASWWSPVSARVLSQLTKSNGGQAARMLWSAPESDKNLPVGRTADTNPPDHGNDLATTQRNTGDSILSNILAKTEIDTNNSSSGSSLTMKHLNEPSSDTRWTFQQYWFESDVTAPPALRNPRLVDTPEHADNFTLWLDLLRFQKRINGHTGVWKIFEGMRARQKDVPVRGPEAEPLWKAFVFAGQHLDKTEQIWEHAKDLYKRTHQRFEGLHEILVGSSMARGIDALSNLRAKTGTVSPHEPGLWYKSAYVWHRMLREIDLPTSSNLKALMHVATKDKGALEIVRRIRADCRNRNRPHDIGNRLVPEKQHKEVEHWRTYKIVTADPPSKAIAARLQQHSSDSGLASTPQVPPARPRPKWDDGTPTPHRLFDRHNDDRKLPITDQFCARAFATKAFNPSLVITFLETFGVESIGPLAVQSLALRCRDLVEIYGTKKTDKFAALADELALHFGNLRFAGIKIQECKYSVFVQKLASERDGQLLDATISSDQHPDVYEDEVLQQQLFDWYIRAGDTTQALKTLAVLTFNNPDPPVYSWNILLQSRMRSASLGSQADWHRLSHVFETMLARNVPISKETIQDSFFTLLGPRNLGRAPAQIQSPVDRLSFVANMWTSILKKDWGRKVIDPKSWIEIYKRFGMRRRLDEVEPLILLLARRYSSSVSANEVAQLPGLGSNLIRTPRSKRNIGKPMIDRLFPDIRQKTIIEWYFKSLSESSSVASDEPAIQKPWEISSLSHVEKWARGVALVQELKTFGLSVDTRTVRDACRRRLIYLFGNRVPTNVENRVAKKQNPHTLRYMVSYLQRMWQPTGTLFAVPEHILTNASEDSDQYLRHIVLNQPAQISQFYSRHRVAPRPDDRPRGLNVSKQDDTMDHSHAIRAMERVEKLRSFIARFGERTSRHSRHSSRR